MKNPLLVNALELLRRPGSERPVEIDVAPESIQIVDDRLAPGADISVRLVCASLSDGIVVEGLVTAHFRGDCRRCLAPVAGELECSIRELYQVNLTDPDAFPIVNDQIDLSVMVRETRDFGIIRGPQAVSDAGLIDMSLTQNNPNLLAGQGVVTSGLGGVFPPGIVVGTIADTRPAGGGLYTAARLKPGADLARLDRVWIIQP